MAMHYSLSFRSGISCNQISLWLKRLAKQNKTPEWVVISKQEYRRLNFFQGVLLIILLGLLPGLVLANNDDIPTNVKAGSLFVKSPSGEMQEALRMESDVHFAISGLVSRVAVKQHFKNHTQDWLEGIYVFPLPENAAVDRLRIHVGERVIEGVIKEKQEAKKIYQQAKASGKRTALVEQERPNLFTTSVANIGPNEKIIVEISYQQTLEYKNNRFSLRFPMTITPRYIPGQALASETTSFKGTGWSVDTDQVEDASRITPPMKSNYSINKNLIQVTASLDAGFPLSKVNSLYHDINLNRTNHIYAIELQNGKVPMDRDFELFWEPAIGQEPSAALFKENIDGDDYALLMLMPPQADTALDELQKSLSREVVFIIDTSGSMAGKAMEQARQALVMAINTLTPNDRFNVIEFNSVTKKLFTHAIFADYQSRQTAIQYVNNLHSDGGTEMYPAIDAALQVEGLDGFVRQIVFMTDGSVGNEDALFKLIEDDLGESRLFTVGIGSAPNSYFMRKAAQFGRGTYTYISSQNEIASRMQALFEKLQSPVLTHIEFVWDGDEQPVVWPQRVPDLYKNEPILITAKLNDENKSLRVSGKIAGKDWERTLDLKTYAKHPGVAALWARNKIEDLMDKKLNGTSANDIRQKIIDVALKHQLVSQYTSLVAVDPIQARSAKEKLNTSNVANHMPHGSKQAFGFPQAATPAGLQLLIGLIAGLLSFFTYITKKRYEI